MNFEEQVDTELDLSLQVDPAFQKYAVAKAKTAQPQASETIESQKQKEDKWLIEQICDGKLSKNKRLNRQALALAIARDFESESSSSEDEGPIDENKAENDALLYDPKADDKDQLFVNSLRASASLTQAIAQPSTSAGLKGNEKQLQGKLGPTDAILNCPCCMTQLCLDCQRHAIYLTQYRAMFVFHCRVDYDSEIVVNEKRKRRRLGKKDKAVVENTQVEEKLYAVLCEVCNIQVGVFDRNEELYHFNNVIASHS